MGLLSVFATACGTPSSVNSDTNTFVSQDKKLDAYVYIYSESSGADEGRCWHKVMSGKKLSQAQIEQAHTTLLTPEAVPNEAVAESLKRSAQNNLGPLVTSSAGAAGSCAGAIGGVVATATALLTPGAQPLSPLAALSTAASVVGCGASGKSAVDALWNAYYFVNLKSKLPQSDVNAGLNDQAADAGTLLIASLENAKFHTTGIKCTAKN